MFVNLYLLINARSSCNISYIEASLISLLLKIMQVDIDFETEPIGVGNDGKKIFLRDIWPSTEEVAQVNIPTCFKNLSVLEVYLSLEFHHLFLFFLSSGCTNKCAA